MEKKEKTKSPTCSSVKVITNRNEPKVVFDSCKFVTYTAKDGKTYVKCTVISHVRVPKSLMYVDLDKRSTMAQKDITPETQLLDFPYPTQGITTTGVSICDPRDTFDPDLGKRVARFRAEKKAFKIHRKAMRAAVERYKKFLDSAVNLFTVKAEKVESSEVRWDA